MRWLSAMRRAISCSIIRGPAAHQPVGRIGFRFAGFSTGRELAQNGIHDEPGEVACVTIALRKRNGKIDGGVRRHLEKQHLRRRGNEDRTCRTRFARQGLGEIAVDQDVALALTAQRCGDKQMRKGAVAIIELGGIGARERFIERQSFGDDRIKGGYRLAPRRFSRLAAWGRVPGQPHGPRGDEAERDHGPAFADGILSGTRPHFLRDG